MKHKYSAILLLIVFSLFIIGCTQKVPDNALIVPVENNPVVPASTETANTPPVSDTPVSGYYGQILAGKISPYLEFDSRDYQKAVKDGDVILLYFYTDRNSICIGEESKIFKAFDDMANNKMIGFKVHYKDAYATDTEAVLANSLNVTDSHTKVILKNGVIKERSPVTWDLNAYASHMALYLDK